MHAACFFWYKECEMCWLKFCSLGEYYLQTSLSNPSLKTDAMWLRPMFSWYPIRSWDIPSMNQAWLSSSFSSFAPGGGTSVIVMGDVGPPSSASRLFLWPCLGFDPNISLPVMICCFQACPIWCAWQNPASVGRFYSWGHFVLWGQALRPSVFIRTR